MNSLPQIFHLVLVIGVDGDFVDEILTSFEFLFVEVFGGDVAGIFLLHLLSIFLFGFALEVVFGLVDRRHFLKSKSVDALALELDRPDRVCAIFGLRARSVGELLGRERKIERDLLLAEV